MTDRDCNEFHLWSDSFHEGEWACQQIAKAVGLQGGTWQCEFIDGFIPSYTFIVEDIEINVLVYGNYSSWSPQPEALVRLLEWGKPDLVLVQAATGRIVLAVEETAATPTGNQALQRCERQYGAAIEGVPYWYLIPEYAIHSDGGRRRDSVWPALMALELSFATGIPSIVLHYSDALNPGDYEFGKGKASLARVMLRVLINVSKNERALAGLEKEIGEQIQEMLDFVADAWNASLYVEPSLAELASTVLANELCRGGNLLAGQEVVALLTWPMASLLTGEQSARQIARALSMPDPFVERLESAVASGKSYGLIPGQGSRPQPERSIRSWIAMQEKIDGAWRATQKEPNTFAQYSVDIAAFPEARDGRRHVITAPRILYLLDSYHDVLKMLRESFPRLKELVGFEEDMPAAVYVVNSLKPGRIFGDPYSGQFAAYAVSLGAWSKGRRFVCYFPHQSIANITGARGPGKGRRIFFALADVLVFAGGIAYETKTGSIR